LADAHIITQKENAKKEIDQVLDLIESLASTFGLKLGENYSYRLSLGDRNNTEKYFKDDTSWEEAESVLREALVDRKATFVEAENEAAFYGPKIDVQMKNANGKEDTAFTVQYDFVMPKRFDLTYINDSGETSQPVVIHRSSIGAIERVMAFLIEHYAGNFPLWLAPVQVVLLPVSEKFMPYTQSVFKTFKESGIRVELDSTNNTLGNKIREATLQKVPFMCIIGGQEEEKSKDGSQLISVRSREGKDLGQIEAREFIKQIQNTIETKQ